MDECNYGVRLVSNVEMALCVPASASHAAEMINESVLAAAFLTQKVSGDVDD